MHAFYAKLFQCHCAASSYHISFAFFICHSIRYRFFISLVVRIDSFSTVHVCLLLLLSRLVSVWFVVSASTHIVWQNNSVEKKNTLTIVIWRFNQSMCYNWTQNHLYYRHTVCFIQFICYHLNQKWLAPDDWAHLLSKLIRCCVFGHFIDLNIFHQPKELKWKYRTDFSEFFLLKHERCLTTRNHQLCSANLGWNFIHFWHIQLSFCDRYEK